MRVCYIIEPAQSESASVDKYRIRDDSFTMSQTQRVTLLVVGLIALGFGIISFIPDGGVHFEVGSVNFEIYKRRLPIWFTIGWTICAAALLLVCWWKYRKPN
jgi:hypothetical protein